MPPYRKTGQTKTCPRQGGNLRLIFAPISLGDLVKGDYA